VCVQGRAVALYDPCVAFCRVQAMDEGEQPPPGPRRPFPFENPFPQPTWHSPQHGETRTRMIQLMYAAARVCMPCRRLSQCSDSGCDVCEAFCPRNSSRVGRAQRRWRAEVLRSVPLLRDGTQLPLRRRVLTPCDVVARSLQCEHDRTAAAARTGGGCGGGAGTGGQDQPHGEAAGEDALLPSWQSGSLCPRRAHVAPCSVCRAAAVCGVLLPACRRSTTTSTR
jgi:hypothetical protein